MAIITHEGVEQGEGDMERLVYDIDLNSVVDNAEKLAGSPASAYMTKAVYDSNGDGVVSAADAINDGVY